MCECDNAKTWECENTNVWKNSKCDNMRILECATVKKWRCWYCNYDNSNIWILKYGILNLDFKLKLKLSGIISFNF